MNEQPLQKIEAQPTPLELIHKAVQSGAQVEVMEKLLGLQERWERNEARKAFDSAISKAKSEIPIIRKGNSVDFTTSKGRTHYQYEDLATIAQIIDPILSKHGLSYRWRPNSDAKSVTVTCILSHAAGHMEENTLYAPHDLSGNKNPIQAVGSAVTYLQRYTLKAALGLAAAADDDARSVSQPKHEPEPGVDFKVAPAPKAKAPATPPAEQVLPRCEVKMVTERKGTKKDGTPWTAYFILLNDGFADLEVGTFSKTLAGIASTLSESDQPAEVTFKPGKIEGKFDLVNILPVDQEHTPKQQPTEHVQEVIP